MVSNLAARLLALVTMPILTGLLSPDVYGSAALAATLISLLSVFALAGVDVSYVRAYQNKNDHNPDAVEAYAWRFALAASAMVALIAWIAWPYLADALGLEGYLILFVVADIITHEHNGLLVPVADVPELARAMDRLADAPQLRERLGEQAIAVRREYQANRIAQQWSDLLVKLKR